MDSKPQPGDIIADHFELLSVAGKGGMGTVFKARDLQLARIVAVKFLEPMMQQDLETTLRFEREAKVLSRLRHIHIAAFYLFGCSGSNPYLIMEWLDGQSLADQLQKLKKLSPTVAIKITMQAADALSHAHKAGIVHRDLKPGNVMLVSDVDTQGIQHDSSESHECRQRDETLGQYFVKLVDFGLARSALGPQDLTKSGVIVGTPQYLSPEQGLGQQVDARSDIYSLGTILFEMICGEPPFVADNAVVLVYKHTNEEVPRLSAKVKALPEGLEGIVLKCLEKKPDDRYQSMEDLCSDLEKVRLNRGSEIPAWRRGGRVGLGKHLLASMLPIAGILALFGFLFIVLHSGFLDDAIVKFFCSLQGNNSFVGQEEAFANTMMENFKVETARILYEDLSKRISSKDNPRKHRKIEFALARLYADSNDKNGIIIHLYDGLLANDSCEKGADYYSFVAAAADLLRKAEPGESEKKQVLRRKQIISPAKKYKLQPACLELMVWTKILDQTMTGLIKHDAEKIYESVDKVVNSTCPELSSLPTLDYVFQTLNQAIAAQHSRVMSNPTSGALLRFMFRTRDQNNSKNRMLLWDTIIFGDHIPVSIRWELTAEYLHEFTHANVVQEKQSVLRLMRLSQIQPAEQVSCYFELAILEEMLSNHTHAETMLSQAQKRLADLPVAESSVLWPVEIDVMEKLRDDAAIHRLLQDTVNRLPAEAERGFSEAGASGQRVQAFKGNFTRNGSWALDKGLANSAVTTQVMNCQSILYTCLKYHEEDLALKVLDNMDSLFADKHFSPDMERATAAQTAALLREVKMPSRRLQQGLLRYLLRAKCVLPPSWIQEPSNRAN